MKNIYKITAFVVCLVFAISFASALWPFGSSQMTGNVVSIPSKILSCNESDGAGSEFNASGVSFSYYKGGVVYYSHIADSCKKNVVTEYSCQGQNKIIKKTIKCAFGCDNDTINLPEPDESSDVASFCISSGNAPVGSIYCLDSDGGSNASVAGAVYGINENGRFSPTPDRCLTNYSLREAVCNDDAPNFVTLACKGGSSGKCVNKTISVKGVSLTAGVCQPQELQCSDSDGGLNKTGRGIVFTTDVSGRLTSVSDTCHDETSVNEVFCSGNVSNHTILTCDGTDVCRKGACVPKRSQADYVYCTDTDGDKLGQARNYMVRGIVSAKNSTGNVIGSVTDFCASPKILSEHGCIKIGAKTPNARRVVARWVLCRDGCLDGACLSNRTTLLPSD